MAILVAGGTGLVGSAIVRELERVNKKVIGICGGYQMMGEEVCDPFGVESDALTIPGLGLLPIKTTLAKEKTTIQQEFKFKNFEENLNFIKTQIEFSGNQEKLDIINRELINLKKREMYFIINFSIFPFLQRMKKQLHLHFQVSLTIYSQVFLNLFHLVYPLVQTWQIIMLAGPLLAEEAFHQIIQ